MKATDLMIGDWVQTPANPHYMVVEGDFWRDVESHGTLFPLFEPIPLTPNILEKNGWWKDETDGTYHNTMNVYGLKAPFSILDGVIINYVHELQHALRLCGLEEMANKFEI